MNALAGKLIDGYVETTMELKALSDDLAKVAKELDTDARFVAKLYDDATKEYKKLLAECSVRVHVADKLGSVLFHLADLNDT